MRALQRSAHCVLLILLLIPLALWPLPSPAGERPILRGSQSQFIYLRPLEQVGSAPFLDGAGQAVDFSRFRGRVVLVNLWASWCAPCVREMPALDRLQREIGGDRFQVVAIALDTAGLEAVAPFFRRHRLAHLPIYLDPSHRTVHTDARNAKGAPFAVYALPISYLLDEHGRAIGYLKGAADWTSPEAMRFLKHLIDESAAGAK